MARGRRTKQAVAAQVRRGRAARSNNATRRLGTSEARTALPTLVKELAARTEPSESLAENAVEIGPHRTGGVWLVPEVDARAAQEALAAAEEELENIAIGFMLEDRLEQPSGVTSGRDVIRDLGFTDLLEGLPGELRG